MKYLFKSFVVLFAVTVLVSSGILSFGQELSNKTYFISANSQARPYQNKTNDTLDFFNDIQCFENNEDDSKNADNLRNLVSSPFFRNPQPKIKFFIFNTKEILPTLILFEMLVNRKIGRAPPFTISV